MVRHDLVIISENEDGTFKVKAGSGDPLQWETITETVEEVIVEGILMRTPEHESLGTAILEGTLIIENEPTSRVTIRKE